MRSERKRGGVRDGSSAVPWTNLWTARFGWITGLSVAAALIINAAGIGAIALTRRSHLEEAARALTLRTEARARALESTLAGARADLAFLAGSPVFHGIEGALASRDPREARWRRLEAEGSLLLFLRGHPEVKALSARSADGRRLLEARRRGGVPVLWVGDESAPSGEGAESGVRGRVALATGVRRVQGTVLLDATLDPARMLAAPEEEPRAPMTCRLFDGEGKTVAPAAAAAEGEREEEWLAAAAPVNAEGWSAPGPWRLSCRQPRGPALALVEPFAKRYRMTLIFDLVVMTMAILLGAFAVQQQRRQQALAAAAREEARVRDLERRLFHAERLTSVGRLAAGMAHEINNPLEGMTNYLELARAELARADVAAARRRLDGVAEGIERIGALVRQMLAHADPAPAPGTRVDLNAALRRTAAFVGERAEFRAVRFEFDLDPASPAALGSDVLLGQVFLNLILNACEAQPKGGEALLRTRAAAGTVTIEVADRGPGVDAADGARIFEPFFSTKSSTGLGLSICHSIVTRHGGTLGVVPRDGGGSVFRMTLPAAAEREGAPPGRAAGPERAGSSAHG